jgi:hypothetical protein
MSTSSIICASCRMENGGGRDRDKLLNVTLATRQEYHTDDAIFPCHATRARCLAAEDLAHEDQMRNRQRPPGDNAREYGRRRNGDQVPKGWCYGEHQWWPIINDLTIIDWLPLCSNWSCASNWYPRDNRPWRFAFWVAIENLLWNWTLFEIRCCLSVNCGSIPHQRNPFNICAFLLNYAKIHLVILVSGELLRIAVGMNTVQGIRASQRQELALLTSTNPITKIWLRKFKDPTTWSGHLSAALRFWSPVKTTNLRWERTWPENRAHQCEIIWWIFVQLKIISPSDPILEAVNSIFRGHLGLRCRHLSDSWDNQI